MRIQACRSARPWLRPQAGISGSPSCGSGRSRRVHDAGRQTTTAPSKRPPVSKAAGPTSWSPTPHRERRVLHHGISSSSSSFLSSDAIASTQEGRTPAAYRARRTESIGRPRVEYSSARPDQNRKQQAIARSAPHLAPSPHTAHIAQEAENPPSRGFVLIFREYPWTGAPNPSGSRPG